MCIGKVARVVLVSILVTLLAFASTAALEDANGANASSEPGFSESTSLWKVETDSSTVYLMGSIHVLKETDYPLHPKMNRAFEEAGTLVLELHLDSTRTPAFRQYVLEKAAYDSGKTLRTELPDSVYELLDTSMQTLGLDLDMMKQFKPWMVALTFVNFKLQQLGFSPDLGVDTHFFAKAKATGMNIEALEKPEDQIGVFDSMSPAMQEALVLQMLEEAADIEESVGLIVIPWKTGDLEGLLAELDDRFEGFPEIRRAMITRRNHTWIPEIEGYIAKRGTHLIIMGVAHLPGEDGVIALLREAGYQVEQL